MTGTCIDTIRIQGFKSLENCTLSLGRINIVLGPNGVGKSSFLQVFSLLQQAASKRLQLFLSKQGGPNALLCYGGKKTSQLAFSLSSSAFSYSCILEPTLDGRFVFRQENLVSGAQRLDFKDPGYFESALCSDACAGYEHMASSIRSWRPAHFNDTSDFSPIKQRQSISDNLSLRHDGSNIAPVLFRLKMEFPDYYARIVRMVHLIAPFFKDFLLRPCPENHSQIELEWIDKEGQLPRPEGRGLNKA